MHTASVDRLDSAQRRRSVGSAAFNLGRFEEADDFYRTALAVLHSGPMPEGDAQMVYEDTKRACFLNRSEFFCFFGNVMFCACSVLHSGPGPEVDTQAAYDESTRDCFLIEHDLPCDCCGVTRVHFSALSCCPDCTCAPSKVRLTCCIPRTLTARAQKLLREVWDFCDGVLCRRESVLTSLQCSGEKRGNGLRLVLCWATRLVER